MDARPRPAGPRALHSHPDDIVLSELSGPLLYGPTGIVDTKAVFDFKDVPLIDLSCLTPVDRPGIPSEIHIVGFKPQWVTDISSDNLMTVASNLLGPKWPMLTGTLSDVSIAAACTPSDRQTSSSGLVHHSSTTSVGSNTSAVSATSGSSLRRAWSKVKRRASGPSTPAPRRPRLVPTPRVAPLTMLLVSLCAQKDMTAVAAVLATHPVAICYDLRMANLLRWLPLETTSSLIHILQVIIHSHGAMPTDSRIRALAHILHAMAADREIIKELKSDNDRIQAKIEGLFLAIPRLHPKSVPLYAIRCGLVYGVVAVHEGERYDREARRLKVTSNVVSGMAGMTSIVPDVNGVPVGKIVAAPTNGVAAAIISGIDEQKKHLAHSVVLVESKFRLQVLGEADRGLEASYGNNVPHSAHGFPIPAFSVDTMNKFKDRAWCVFSNAILEENRVTLVERPEPIKEPPEPQQPQQPWGWPAWMPGSPPRPPPPLPLYTPRVSADRRAERFVWPEPISAVSDPRSLDPPHSPYVLHPKLSGGNLLTSAMPGSFGFFAAAFPADTSPQYWKRRGWTIDSGNWTIDSCSWTVYISSVSPSDQARHCAISHQTRIACITQR